MDTILEMRGIQKSFGAVKALTNVDLSVKQGEIHAICGENGAGKSTLMKILSGVYPHGSFNGSVVYDGIEREFDGIHESEAVGIIIIHQELALVPMLSITENIFLGNEQAKGGVIDWQGSFAKAKQLLGRVGLTDAPDTLIGTLGIGKQQLVEIAKALSKEVRLLILDEPTASLNDKDSDTLLTLLLELKSRGVTSIIISHKLNEISRVADAITVIRDGSTVDALDCKAESVSEDRIIKAMVGREMSDRYPKRTPDIGEVVFEIRDWRVQHPTQRERTVIKGVNLQARRGEIVGIAGLMGSGRTELAMSVFGGTYGRDISGTVLMKGKQVDTSSVQRAINCGIAYVTEDRKGNGLLLDDNIQRNISLANLGGVSKAGVVNEHEEITVASDFLKKLRIRAQGVNHVVGNLSGGNQQKVVLSKWLFSEPDVLILDEPTRGIDVGAKYEIYNIINQVVAAGKCVVMISSEMPELLGMCDRVYVMNEGRFVGEFTAEEVSQEKIMRAIMRNGGN
ncbi:MULTISPECIES: multiple monosaccharide ABC transporter ATP-binding protein [unclassified Caballeronia]|uniref:multiple monosaccharide ABC transporter ATP-binding protein n=1 Tax=unclassified Caballeronia TaxID=2646786 RepID=UPI00025B9A12|nr:MULTISPECIES: multiple monosaccharide ABC transporter ATP-binding protein [unclassified Caballeronia]EKS70353.1 sugar ABC transporter [Burkholderia sp. SJ98]MCE4546373.1 sugar ABC transporter ATP-binding protein [Caballeronia sp. PC1]MCE4573152.1 sugar ABC transporter ATP-binding protein [Caballeronia sp. CLC5]